VEYPYGGTSGIRGSIGRFNHALSDSVTAPVNLIGQTPTNSRVYILHEISKDRLIGENKETKTGEI
jgi:hypothetical protein